MIKLEFETPKDIVESYILLTDEYLYYKTEYYADFNESGDDKMPWTEDMYSYLEELISRDQITGIYLNWKRKNQNWKILISANGVTDDVFIMFNDIRKAQSMFQQLRDWIYPPAVDLLELSRRQP
jgi:hypothetical protein